MRSIDITRRGFAGGVAATSLFGGTANAQTPGKLGANLDEIVAGSKREGKLTAWIVAPRIPATHRALIAAFNKRFGLDTQLEWVPNPPITSNTRAIAEAAGGAVSVDIIGGASIDALPKVADAKLVSPYPWSDVFGAAFPVLKDMEAMVMPKYRGLGLPYQIVTYGYCWNPEAIADADVPDRLADLADPKWKGKFAFNAFLVPLDVVSYAWGDDATTALAKRIFANMPVFARGSPPVASAVNNGEVPFGVTVSAVAETMQRAREKIRFKLFTDVIPVSTVYLTVPDAAPHPNTARLFAAWLAAEGSAVGNPIEPMERPGDTNSTLGRMIAAAQAKSGSKIAEPRTEADLASSAKLVETLQQMLNGQTK